MDTGCSTGLARVLGTSVWPGANCLLDLGQVCVCVCVCVWGGGGGGGPEEGPGGQSDPRSTTAGRLGSVAIYQ